MAFGVFSFRNGFPGINFMRTNVAEANTKSEATVDTSF
jgi:hypothetical protein